MKIKPSHLRLLHRLKDFWPLVIAVPIGAGYLNFNVYCSVHNLGHASVDLPVIVGLGLFYLTIAVIVGFWTLGKKPNSRCEILILSAFLLVNGLTVGWFIAMIVHSVLGAVITLLQKNARIGRIIDQFLKFSPFTIEFLIIIPVSIFIDIKLFAYTSCLSIVILGNAFLLKEKNNADRLYKLVITNLMLVILVLPLLLFFNLGTTLYGVGKQHVRIETTDERKLEGYIFLESSDFVYFQADSVSRQPGITEKIPIDYIKSIQTHKVSPDNVLNQSLLSFVFNGK